MLCFSIVSWLRRFAKVGPKSEVARRIGCPRSRQNLHHACARERFGCQNREKNHRFGALLEVELPKNCTTPARESDLEVKIVKNWRCRGTFGNWAPQKFAPRLRGRAIWKSKSLKTDGLGTFLEVESAFRVAGAGISTRCKIRGRRRSSWGLQKRWQAWWIWRGSETMRFAWQAQGFRALWCRCLKPATQNPWKGCKFHVTEVLLCSDHFAWQLQDFVCLGSTFSWQAQYFWSIHLKILKRIGILRSSDWSTCHFWRKSRTKASFELQTFIFEGSLAEMLRFWSSKLHFWRKSRRNASFLSFKASFLKEVSQKCFVFDLQSFNFEGSLAEMLRFWSSKLQFRRKSRRKASFLIFKASILTSQTIWHPNHLNLKSLDNQTTWISNHSTSKSLELRINWQPKSFESQITWQPNHLNLESFDVQITWISNHLTTKPPESQIIRHPNHLNSESVDNQNHLNLKSDDNQVTWISNQMTTEPFDSHFTWIWHQLTFEPIELHTPSSYRFLIFGNFRHRLVR